MNEETKPAVPVWFWIVATVALLWNLMGCGVLTMEMFFQEEAIATFTEEQKEWTRSTPAWIYFVFAISVSTGVAGSLGLFLRKGWTVFLFVICLAAVLVQMVYTMLIAGGLQVMGPSGAIMPAVVVVLAVVWAWFSWFSKGKGWLDR
jgi:hypothetical protein